MDTLVKDTESLLHFNGSYKQPLVYHAGYISHKGEQPDVDMSEDVTCEFWDELNRGRLRVPTHNTVFFVHCAQYIYNKLEEFKKRCITYFQNLISHIYIYIFFL